MMYPERFPFEENSARLARNGPAESRADATWPTWRGGYGGYGDGTDRGDPLR